MASVQASSLTGNDSVENQPAPALRLKFWGVRGSIPTPGPGTVEYGGNTSCLEVRAGGQIIILDAGSGLRLLGQALAAEFDERPLELTLLLTHSHWDHIHGLPFFKPLYHSNHRLHILGFEGERHDLQAVLSGQMESPVFPVGLRQVPAQLKIEALKECDFQIGPVRVQACPTRHPDCCVGYRLSTGDSSLAFFPDNELPTQGEAAKEQRRKLVGFLQGTDVLVMDAQYDREEYRRHVGWGHGCLDEVVALALQAGVKQLFLFHHDPDHDDARVTQMTLYARQLVAAHKGVLRVDAAREGLVVELPG